jgi:hypothetical protein
MAANREWLRIQDVFEEAPLMPESVRQTASTAQRLAWGSPSCSRRALHYFPTIKRRIRLDLPEGGEG